MNAPAPILRPAVRAADLGDAAEVPRLDAFVAGHPDGSVFHRPQWSRAVELGCRQRAHYLVAERGGVIAGVLPLSEIRSPLFGNVLVSAGFATGGGLVADNAKVAESLGDAAWSLAQRLGCGSVELRGGAFPGGWTGKSGVYANFERPLSGDGDVLLKSIPRRQRAEIRRGLDSGLTSTCGVDATHREIHYRVYAESVRNLGTPVFPRRLFEAMLDAFPGESDVTAVWRDGHPVASVLSFYFRGTCLSYWGGGTAEARDFRGNDVVHFEVMRRAVERGCTRADFGRSKIGTGNWQRKRNWAFDETPLVYATRTANGQPAREINPLSPKYRLQVAAWSKLPLWLANRLGPAISRGLG